MLSRFTPLSDEELEALEKPLEAGPGTFEIISCDDVLSKNGNPMYVLQLNVTDDNGSTRLVKDYIVKAGLGMRKLKHFCESIGFSEEYKKGILNLNLLPKKRGLCVIGYRDGTDKQGNPAKFAEIQDYIPSAQGQAKPVKERQAQSDYDFDDSIPF